MTDQWMDFQSDSPPYEAPESGVQEEYRTLPAPTGQAFGEEIKQTIETGLGAAGRVVRYGQFQGASFAERAASALLSGATSPEYQQAGIAPPAPGSIPTPMLQPKEYNEKYAPRGPDGQIIPIGDKPMPEGIAQIAGQAMKDKIQRESVIARYQNSHSWPVTFATATAAAILDPRNVAAFFVPPIGEEMIAGRLLTAGVPGFLARTTARAAAAGATFGATAIPGAATRYALSSIEDGDYSMRQALSDVFYTAAGGALLHAGFGAIFGDRLLGTPRPETPAAPPEAPAAAAVAHQPPQPGGGAPAAAPVRPAEAPVGATAPPAQVGPEIIDAASLRAAHTDVAGFVNMAEAGDATEAQVRQALSEGREVNLIMEGKPHRIVSVSPLGLVDEDGNPWGVGGILMPLPGEHDRIEIGEGPSASTGAPIPGMPSGVQHDAMASAVAQMAQGQPVDVGPVFEAWHGSGAVFNAFSDEHILTGQGANVQGRGHYVAEAPGVAVYHQIERPSPFIWKAAEIEHELRRMKAYTDEPLTEDDAHEAASARGLDRDVERYPGLLKLLTRTANETAATPEWSALSREIKALLTSIDGQEPQMYRVAVQADREHFLDWDRPLSEQSPHVQAALGRIPGLIEAIDADLAERQRIADPRQQVPEGKTGADIHATLSEMAGGDTMASRALQQAGIPGTRYLDAQSRRLVDVQQDLRASESRLKAEESLLRLKSNPTEEHILMVEAFRQETERLREEAANFKQTRNYVVFDPARIRIMERNGVSPAEVADKVKMMYERGWADGMPQAEFQRVYNEVFGQKESPKQMSEIQPEKPAAAPKAEGEKVAEGPDPEVAAAQAALLQSMEAKGLTKPPKPRRPPTLLQFLADRGVLDESGELTAMDLDKWHRGKPFQKKLINEKGMDLDQAREAAEEAGYIGTGTNRVGYQEGAPTTVADLLDAMKQDSNKDTPVYSWKNPPPEAEFDVAANEDMRATAKANADQRELDWLNENLGPEETQELAAAQAAENEAKSFSDALAEAASCISGEGGGSAGGGGEGEGGGFRLEAQEAGAPAAKVESEPLMPGFEASGAERRAAVRAAGLVPKKETEGLFAEKEAEAPPEHQTDIEDFTKK